MQKFAWLVALAVASTVPNAAFGAISLTIQPVVPVMSGQTADVCIVLDSGGASVAGTQNDLHWDGTCATLASPADCRINPAIDKSLAASLLRSDFTYRGIVLSLSDLDPIPDGVLYCCPFIVDAAPGNCCPIEVLNALGAEPGGTSLPADTDSAQLCAAASDGGPTPTPTVHGDAFGSSDSNGCQIDPVGSPAYAAGLLGAALLLARRRARAHVR